MLEGFTCPQCNRGEIQMRAGPHRRMRYRHMPGLELPETLELPTCTACGERWLDAEALRNIDTTLEAEYRRQLTLKAERAIEALQPHMPQRDLERLLGMSAGWLSKLKNGREPSAPLTALLMLLAAQPERLEELQRLWAVRPKNKRPAKTGRRGPSALNGSRSR